MHSRSIALWSPECRLPSGQYTDDGSKGCRGAAYPVGAIGKFIDRQTLHRRGKWNVAFSGSRHSKSGRVVALASSSLRGSTKLASLCRVFPTALPTFHTFIFSAG